MWLFPQSRSILLPLARHRCLAPSGFLWQEDCSPARLAAPFVSRGRWNFAEESMEFLQPYRARGGRFILPIPEPKIL
jgi:hypothetical protein